MNLLYFTNLFTNTSAFSAPEFLLCIFTALAGGLILSLFYRSQAETSGSFIVTLALLPAVVCAIILIVNDSIGTAVAVAGAFSLVRFRSAPGTAREICAIFLAMAIGLIAGAGYLICSLVFAALICLVWFLYRMLDLGQEKKAAGKKYLRITIPESLDYPNAFEDIFSEFTSSHRLTEVKTTDMGSLFRLNYEISLKDASREKELIDALRCRNGNLEIRISCQPNSDVEL